MIFFNLGQASGTEYVSFSQRAQKDSFAKVSNSAALLTFLQRGPSKVQKDPWIQLRTELITSYISTFQFQTEYFWGTEN